MTTSTMPCRATRHDTLNAYQRHGCRCDAARRENAEAQARVKHNSQAATSHAVHYDLPWTAEDDELLLTARGTVAERARMLGRTFYAAESRLSTLRARARPG